MPTGSADTTKLMQDLSELRGRFVSILQFRPNVEIYLETIPDVPPPPEWHRQEPDRHVIAFSHCVVVRQDGTREWVGSQDRDHYFKQTVESAPKMSFVCEETVQRAYVGNDGALCIEFDTGTIYVPPTPDGEAWQVRGPDGYLLVCPPGGYS